MIAGMLADKQQLFIVSYGVGSFPDCWTEIVPVYAGSEIELRAKIDAAIKYKQELKKQSMAATDAYWERYHQIPAEEITTDPEILRRADVMTDLSIRAQSNTDVNGMSFPFLDGDDGQCAQDMDIATLEEWIEENKSDG